MIHDYCIIGGGIVGLATAHALLRRQPGASLVLIEKEASLGRHQTGRNSGVIHSGIYYTPGGLKARLCREGMTRTKAFCNEHGIPFEERGKLIVATDATEKERLRALCARARENQVHAEWLEGQAVCEREPNVRGEAAIFVPASAIVDYKAILSKIASLLSGAGAEVRLGEAPSSIVEHGDHVEIACPGVTIRARRLIACAGLQSDRLARLAGMKIGHRIVPFRGEYFRLSPARNDLVRAMIYPVPEPGLPFLGIHLTPLIDGSISVGPNAMLGLAREGYAKGSVSLRDVADMASFPGFWRTLAKNIRPGLMELANSLFRSRYLEACRKYCPSLELDDLQPMEPGIRAQAVMADGSMADDFLFLQTARMLHVCNAPSPAATSAFPIGDLIAERVEAG